MSRHEKIDYVEYPSRNLEATKRFFGEAFGWTCEDYGPAAMSLRCGPSLRPENAFKRVGWT